MRAAPLILGLCWGATSHAEGYDWSVRGYAYVRYFDYVGADTDPQQIDVRVRPHVKLTYPEGGTIVIEPQAAYSFGRGQESYERTGDVVTLERLYGEFDFPRATVILGKQAVNWGSGQLFNPTDVFDDVYLRDVQAESSGHPAARVAIPFGATRELVALLSSDDRFLQGLGAMRGRATFGTTDVALVASRNPYRRADMAGFDVKGEAKVGLWLEAAYWNPWHGKGYARAVAGVDYSFRVRDVLYLALQAYYDGSGETEVARYDLPAYLRRERATLARHYATITGRLDWSGDLSLGTVSVYNLDDDSVLATLYADVKRIDDFTITIGTSLLTGKSGGEFHPPAGLDPTGLLPRGIAYLWVRYHF